MTLLELKNSPAVIEHVRMLHTKMRRMANYSLLCKVSCVLLLIAAAGVALMCLKIECHFVDISNDWMLLDDVLDLAGDCRSFFTREVEERLSDSFHIIFIALFLIDSYFTGIRRRTKRACDDFVRRLNTEGEAVSEELLLSEPAKPRKDKTHEKRAPEDLLSHLTNTKNYQSSNYHKAEHSSPATPSPLSRFLNTLAHKCSMIKCVISPSVLLFYAVMLILFYVCQGELHYELF